ncbi:hypothetical protein NDU88_005952 [Pleurodeles waltl]|uniref:Uncharacterized protein n=1 Tax=Pleurodeles waltl TaxID=8319 RepID=A0AAV7MEG6_PLEWA|nr:hypothetical protein NDU88_005952 [Pleurodeles waltl]
MASPLSSEAGVAGRRIPCLDEKIRPIRLIPDTFTHSWGATPQSSAARTAMPLRRSRFLPLFRCLLGSEPSASIEASQSRP